MQKATPLPHKPDATQPASYQRRILLAVSGLSPQIVTETIYALAAQADPGRPLALGMLGIDPPGFHTCLFAQCRARGTAQGR